MGVWQVTNEAQPYVGQWDAVTDCFWDGWSWVHSANWLRTTYKWVNPPQEVIDSFREKETQAQDPWEALKSMF